MPGYGYAKAPKDNVDAWTRLVFSYLRGRASLKRVFLLIDARHGIKKNDGDVMDLLDKAAVSYQIVLTKIDKIKPPAVVKLLEATALGIARHPAAFPRILATSSEKTVGLDELKAEIASLAD
jgi:GTP-binding protein